MKRSFENDDVEYADLFKTMGGVMVEEEEEEDGEKRERRGK